MTSEVIVPGQAPRHLCADDEAMGLGRLHATQSISRGIGDVPRFRRAGRLLLGVRWGGFPREAGAPARAAISGDPVGTRRLLRPGIWTGGSVPPRVSAQRLPVARSGGTALGGPEMHRSRL